MATKFRLHNTPGGVAGYKAMDLALGPAGRTVISTVTNAAVSGTDIQLTATAGGSTLAWISEPLSAGFTLSGTVTANIYGGESAATVNAGFRVRLYKYSGGVEGSAILTADMSTELNTTLTTARNWTGTPSSTVFATGDRIVVKLFITNVGGTMAAGTVTGHYDGPTNASDGDSSVQINETVTMTAEGGSGGTPSIVQWVDTADMDANGQDLASGAAVKVMLPNKTLLGNGLVLFLRSGFNSTTWTVTDDQGNTWLPGPGARDASTSGLAGYCYFCPNAAANTRVISVTPNSTQTRFSAVACEVYNMATASALDASALTIASTGTSPMTSGSMTPTVSGDILLQFTFNAPPGAGSKPTSFTVGTAGSPNITWKFLSSDTKDGMCVTYGQYNSTSAINPSTTAAGGPSGLCSIGVAFKASASGTLATGMRIIGIQAVTIEAGDGTGTQNFQLPTAGNLIVFGITAGSQDITAPPVDGDSNAWAACGALALNGSNESARLYYAPNTAPNNRLLLTFSLTADISDPTIFLIDIAGAAAAPFAGGTDYVTATGDKSGVSDLTTLTLTPSKSLGIAIGLQANEFNTVNAVNSPWLIQNGFLPTNTSNSPYYENNGFATWMVTSGSATALTWSYQGGLGADISFWASCAAFFRADFQPENFRTVQHVYSQNL